MKIRGFDVDVALAPYGLRRTGGVQLLVGGEDNLNVRVPTADGDVVVRRYDLSDGSKVAAQHEFVDYIARGGFPTPGPIATLEGALWVQLERPIGVFPFKPGTAPTWTTYELAGQMGYLLGRLHQLGAEWGAPSMGRMDRFGLLNAMRDGVPDLEGSSRWCDAVGAFLNRHGRDLRQMLTSLPHAPLHHDLHRLNLLADDERLTAVLDFDELNYGPLLIDLARACHYLAKEAPDLRLSAAALERLLAGYESVRPLTPEERYVLPTTFDFVNLVDAALFLQHPEGIAAVDECISFQLYLANTKEA